MPAPPIHLHQYEASSSSGRVSSNPLRLDSDFEPEYSTLMLPPPLLKPSPSALAAAAANVLPPPLIKPAATNFSDLSIVTPVNRCDTHPLDADQEYMPATPTAVQDATTTKPLKPIKPPKPPRVVGKQVGQQLLLDHKKSIQSAFLVTSPSVASVAGSAQESPSSPSKPIKPAKPLRTMTQLTKVDSNPFGDIW